MNANLPTGGRVGDPTVLAGGLVGDVVLPGDGDYEQVRNAKFGTGSPSAVVLAAAEGDVAVAVAYARDNGLALSVRSGGHGATGYGTNDGGLVIDLSRLNAVEVIDEARHLVRIGAGAQWGMVADALGPYGLAISAGDTRDVGVGGLLLHGGIGWMVRSHGLTIDNLTAAELVTAAGELLRVDAENHPDLFWAVRGGGGNVGVVTAFEVAAHPTTAVLHGEITYPIEELSAVLPAWAAAMRAAPEELTSFLSVHPGAFGPRAVHVGVTYNGDDEAAAERALLPLRRLGAAASDEVKLVPYGEVLFDMQGGPPPGMVRSASSSLLVPALSDELLATVVRAVLESEELAIDVRALGGAPNRVPGHATAFPHRDSEAVVTTARMSFGDGYEEAVAAIGGLRQRLTPYATGAYANFTSETDPDTMRLLYPDRTYTRLAEVKQRYDPDNLFRLNHNVQPV